MGVVMFNGDQQCLIESVLDQARRSDSSLQADFDRKQTNEPIHPSWSRTSRMCRATTSLSSGSHWSGQDRPHHRPDVLAHGFGFASALQEIGLPANAAVPALAAFNIGVEIGQVVIVALIFPLLLLSDRIGRRAATRDGRNLAVVYFCSAAILPVGLYWLMVCTVFP
jgi:HupE/UreJ protein